MYSAEVNEMCSTQSWDLNLFPRTQGKEILFEGCSLVAGKGALRPAMP